MILLSTDKADYQKVAKEILASPHSLHRQYRILDTSHLRGGGDREKFDYAIEILDVLNFYYKINDMFRNLGIKKEIDSSILLEAITHLFEDKPFSKEQLIRYYELKIEEKYVTDSMDMIIEYEDYMISWEVDFILLGLPYEKYSKAVDDMQDKLFDEYARIHFKMENKEWSINEFTKRARGLLKAIKEVEPAELV